MEVGALLAGKYRLVRQLGDGGMGTVYEARHEILGTSFAIKVLHPDLARRPGLVDRFLREAHVAAQIKSPHVVSVFDVDRTPDGTAYIVMELLGGEPLSRALDRERRLTPAVAIGYTLQILQALEVAHGLNVVHRDLKPDNIFLTPGPTGPVVKLIDFGIAKLRSADPAAKNLTAFGVVMGTPEYMAPEQAFSADRADARSDIYAVGVLLYEMLAGTRPATGEDAQTVAAKVHRGEIVPLVHAAPGVPGELAGLVHRAISARPELRFASVAEMSAALAALAPSLATSPAFATGTVLARPLASPAPSGVSGPGTALRTAPPDVAPAHSPVPPPYATPYAHAPHPSMPSYAEAPARRQRSALPWVIGVPLVLGAAGAVVVLMLQAEDAPPAPSIFTPTTTATPVPPVETVPAPTLTPPTTALPPLVSGQVPPPLATQKPPTAPSAKPPTGDAGPVASAPTTTTPTLPFPPFPSGFPTALPFPMPSAFPLPSGFPAIPSGFGLPPCPPPPQPQ